MPKLVQLLAFLVSLPLFGAQEKLTLLTYNAGLLPADPRMKLTQTERLEKIPGELVRLKPDLVFLQEVWQKEDRKWLLEAVKKHGYRGVGDETYSWTPPYFLGNGLLILAKAPRAFTEAPKYVRFQKTIGLDWVARKGVILVPVTDPLLGKIELIDVHTSYVPFEKDIGGFDPAQEKIQDSQFQQVIDAVKASTARYQILGGDYNVDPHLWDPKKKTFIEDTYSPYYLHLVNDLSLFDTVEKSGVKCLPWCFSWDNDKNDHVRAEAVAEPEKYTPNSRLDHLFTRGIKVVSTKAELVETESIDLKESKVQLSDHFGVLVELEVSD